MLRRTACVAVSGREAIQAAFENAKEVFDTDKVKDSSGTSRCGPCFGSGHSAGEWSGDSSRTGDPDLAKPVKKRIKREPGLVVNLHLFRHQAAHIML